MSAVNVIKANGGSILLTRPNMNKTDKEYLKDKDNVFIVGGEQSISNEIVKFLLDK